MKKLLLTFSIAIFSIGIGDAQTTFFNLYGSTAAEAGERIITVPGGGYLMAGMTKDAGFGSDDIALTRVDASGNILWCRKIGTTGYEKIGDIVAIPGGGFYAVMATIDQNLIWSTMVVKLNANGTVNWTENYSSAAASLGLDILPTVSGGFAILMAESTASNGLQPKIVSCDSSGGILWSNLYIVSDGLANYPKIVECPNGDFGVTWNSYNQSGTNSLHLLRVNSSGSVLWCQRRTLGIYSEEVANVDYANNEFFVEARLGDTTKIYCFNSNGISMWANAIVPPFQAAHVNGGMSYINGKFLLTRFIVDQTLFYISGFIIEFDTSGTLHNSGVLFTGVNTYLNDGEYNSNGDWALCGTAISGFGPPDTSSIFLAVGSPQNGTLCGYTAIPFSVYSLALVATTPVTVSPLNSGTLAGINIFTSSGMSMEAGCIVGIEESHIITANVFPNPANDFLTIEKPFGEATFQLYNNLGQCVRSVQLVGTRTDISVAELAEGVYYYNVVDQDQQLIGTGNVVKE